MTEIEAYCDKMAREYLTNKKSIINGNKKRNTNS